MTFTPIQANHSILKNKVRVGRDKLNRERVTARIVNKGNRKNLAIAIGMDVADVLEMHQGDRVNLYVHKSNKNCFLIKKISSDSEIYQGYKLSGGTGNSHFLRFSIICDLPEMYRISQTIIVDYEIGNNKTLMIDFEKIKYKE